MAQQPPSIRFEGIPLDEARKMGRGSRSDASSIGTVDHGVIAPAAARGGQAVGREACRQAFLAVDWVE